MLGINIFDPNFSVKALRAFAQLLPPCFKYSPLYISKTSQYGPVLFGSLGVAVTVVPISPLFTAGEVARVRETILNGGIDQRMGCCNYKLFNKSFCSTDSLNQLSVFLLFLGGHASGNITPSLCLYLSFEKASPFGASWPPSVLCTPTYFFVAHSPQVLKLAEPKLIVTVDPLVPLVTAAQKELGESNVDQSAANSRPSQNDANKPIKIDPNGPNAKRHFQEIVFL